MGAVTEIVVETSRLGVEYGRKRERDEVLDYIEWVMTLYSPFGEGPLALRHILVDIKDGKHLVRAEKLRRAAAKKPKSSQRKPMPRRAGRAKRK
jgi:hypothetical protein